MAKVYFTDTSVPTEENEYVLWLDIMGTRSRMSTSVRTSIIFICKLHAAILKYKTSGMHVYPMMDGAYITAKTDLEMESFIKKVFSDIAETFIGETQELHRFIIKGALAYGPIVQGENIDNGGSPVFGENEDYLSTVLFGVPMIRANVGEKKAPPFGIYCDESVRMASYKFSYVWYKWFKGTMLKNDEMLASLTKYFSYCQKHTYELEYSLDKIEEHQKMCNQYFEK